MKLLPCLPIILAVVVVASVVLCVVTIVIITIVVVAVVIITLVVVAIVIVAVVVVAVASSIVSITIHVLVGILISVADDLDVWCGGAIPVLRLVVVRNAARRLLVHMLIVVGGHLGSGGLGSLVASGGLRAAAAVCGR